MNLSIMLRLSNISEGHIVNLYRHSIPIADHYRVFSIYKNEVTIRSSEGVDITFDITKVVKVYKSSYAGIPFYFIEVTECDTSNIEVTVTPPTEDWV